MGIPSEDINNAATLLGQKITVNEFVAFKSLTSGTVPILSQKGLLVVSIERHPRSILKSLGNFHSRQVRQRSLHVSPFQLSIHNLVNEALAVVLVNRLAGDGQDAALQRPTDHPIPVSSPSPARGEGIRIASVVLLTPIG